VKGIEQKEYRMIQFDMMNPSNQDNLLLASHYDPRFDGSLRFKLYFRTNSPYNEIVTSVNTSQVTNLVAYLTSVQ
jgi:hypothetical protein